MADETDTGALRVEQVRRAQAERRAAEETGEHQHDRRAERAAYLAAKLAERERSEQERG
jgi:hypothetical protein